MTGLPPRSGSLASALLLALALALVPASGRAQAQTEGVRIAYVDMARLIDSAPQIVAGRARLTREFADADAALRTEQQRLAEMERRLNASDPPLAQADADALAVEAMALRRSIERSRQRLNEEFSSRVQQETDAVWPRIEEAVSGYAREHGYDLVVQGPVVYASGRIDITDRVLERLRQDAQP